MIKINLCSVSKVFQKPIFRQYLVIITANLSSMYFGFNLAWTSPALPKLQNENQTVLPTPISDEDASWIASVSSIGAVAALLITGLLMDKLGRKTCFLLSCIPKIIMSFILLFGDRVWLIIVGRAIDGIASIIPLASVSTYTSEIASKECRGALGAISQVSLAVAMLIVLAVGPYVTYFELNLACTIMICLIALPLCFLPESPYYLYSKGRKEESIKVLIYLRGSEAIAQEELKQYTIPKMDDRSKNFFKDNVNLKTFSKVILLSILVQSIGFNVVFIYMQTILQSTQTTVKDELASVIVGCVQLLASFCTVLLTDTFGRKPILISTLIGMAVGMLGLGVFFKLQQDEFQIIGFLNYLPVISMVLVIFCNSAGIGAIFWTVVAELFDSPYRATGVATSMAVSTATVFIMSKFSPLVMNIIGNAATFFGFSFFCILVAVLVKYIVPETKGKTFGEIQMEMGRRDRVK